MRMLSIATVLAATTLAACGSVEEPTVKQTGPAPIAAPASVTAAPVVQPSSTPQPAVTEQPANTPQVEPTVQPDPATTPLPSPTPLEANTTVQPLMPAPTPTPSPSATPSCTQQLPDGYYDLTCGVYLAAGTGMPSGCPNFHAALWSFDPNRMTISSGVVTVTAGQQTWYPTGTGTIPTDVFVNGRYGAQTILSCDMTLTPAPKD